MRRHREAANISQTDAAERADIDRQQWYRIENGLSGTKRETIERIAAAINWDTETALALGGFGIPKRLETSKPQTVAEFIQRLDEMGFGIRFSADDLEDMGPDDLQDLIDDIEANLIVKTRRKRSGAR